MFMAADYDFIEAQEAYDAQEANDAALREACQSGDLPEVLALLEAGADVNKREVEPDSYTPLMLASAYGHASIAHFLLEADARQDIGLELIYSGAYGPSYLNLQTLQLLRAYAPTYNVVLCPDLQAVPGCQAFLDVTRRWTTQLHYFQLLPAERVARLLAGGADVHARDDSADAPSPIGLARAFLRTGATDVCAGLVVSADPIPWSEGTHASSSRRGGARAQSSCCWLATLSHAAYRASAGRRPRCSTCGWRT